MYFINALFEHITIIIIAIFNVFSFVKATCMHIVCVNRMCLINDDAGSPMSQLITANSNRQLLSTKKQSKIVIMQRAVDTITPVLSRSPQAQLPNSENTNVRSA